MHVGRCNLTLTTTNEPITIEEVDGKYKIFVHDMDSGITGVVSDFKTEKEAAAWWQNNKPRNPMRHAKPGQPGYDAFKCIPFDKPGGNNETK